jgi:sulfate permease, SulP family
VSDKGQGTRDRGHLLRDVSAGLTVAAVAVPQAMAYALIAGIRPEYGLYTAIIMTALGSLFGSSSHLINGPTNAIALVTGSALAVLIRSPNDPDAVQAVFLLAVMVGLMQIAIALLKLGDLTRYVSESVILGFMAGAGLLVALSQLPNLLGLPRRESRYFLYGLWQSLSYGSWSVYPPLVGGATVLLIVGLRYLRWRLKRELPSLLIALIVVSLLTWLLGWTAPGSEALDVVGPVPRTLPPPHLPPIWHLEWMRQLAGSALAIALLGLLEAVAIAKSIAARTRQTLDYNRQCLAEGLANLGGGFFQCMPGSGSLTRSAINYQTGAATRFSGIVAAAAVALVLLLFGTFTAYVPRAGLGGILLWTAWRLVDWQRLSYCFRATRNDAILALATAGTAVFVSIEFSILIGTFLSFLLFVPQASRLQASELVVAPDRLVRERQPDDPRCDKLAILSIEGDLFFGASPELEGHLDGLRKRVEQGVRVVVLRLKRARNPDMVCLERLHHFLVDMDARKVPVLLCGVRADVARAIANVRLPVPAEWVFEEKAEDSSTLQAIRRAYELLGTSYCATCPRRNNVNGEKNEWYYMI